MIDEAKDQKPSATSPHLSPEPPRNGVSSHFEPPDLFSTSLMADVTPSSVNGTVDVSMRRAEAGEKPMDEKEQSALLLPSHVVLDAIPGSAAGPSGGENGDRPGDGNGVGSMEGLYFLDDDLTKVSNESASKWGQLELTGVHSRASLAISTIPQRQPKRRSWRLLIRARSARTASAPDTE